MVRYHLPLLVVPLLAFMACDPVDVSITAFEGPTDSAVVPSGTLFNVDVAFVASSRSGDITKLDLGRQAFLADSAQGGWLRGTPLPTGRTRFLEQIAAFSSDQRLTAEDDSFITLFASDSARESLLVVPYLDSLAGAGADQRCLYGDVENKPVPAKHPICFDYDTTYSLDGEASPAISLSTGSADAYLTDITIRDGYTTTETFYVQWDAALEVFKVRGTMTGPQPSAAIGEAYTTRNSALSFTIFLDGGELADGDGFEVVTTNGIVEIPVGGVIQDLRFEPFTGLLLGSVDFKSGGGALFAIDAELARTQGLSAPLTMINAPEGSRPTRMDLVYPNGEVGMEAPILYLSDPSELGVFHQVDLSNGADGLEAGWTTQEVGFASVDLAFSRAPGVPWLYLGVKDALGAEGSDQTGGGLVRIFDVELGEEVDFNPATPYIAATECIDHCDSACQDGCEGQGYVGEDLVDCQEECADGCADGCHDEGIPVNGPVEGMAASVGQVELATTDLEGRPERDHLIAVTTYAGSVFTIEASRGCLASLEARGSFVLTSEFQAFTSESNVALWSDGQTGRSGQTSRCGGITRSETWLVTYDRLAVGWRVDGSVSGDQIGIAYTDRRYITDGGELSFLIVGGSIPPADGDQFVITTEDGVASFSSLYLPQDLTTYQESIGLTTQGWYSQTVRQAAIIPQNNLDEVILMDLSPEAIRESRAEFTQFQ